MRRVEFGRGFLQDALQHLPLVENRQLDNIDEENERKNKLSPEHKGFRLDQGNDKGNAGS